MIMPLVFKTVLGRWVTAGLIALLLGGGALKWHYFKADLREEGRQECIQVVNEETQKQLEEAIAEAAMVRAELKQQAERAARENASAHARRLELETSLSALAGEMEKQRNEDPKYKAWSDTPLPDGVGDRLRKQAAGDNPSPLRDDSS